MSSLNDKIGHNSAAFEDAALLADDYIDVGPLSGIPGVDLAQLYAFRHAIKTQGNEDVRQKAITQMLNRARANAALSPTAYRLLEHIARRCRGAWRYCTEPQDTIGFFCGVKHRQSTQRSLAELDAMDLGFIASVEVPCSRGGRPRRYYTVACTGSDRLGSSDAELAAAASRRKLEVMNDRASARLVEALQGKASNCCIEPKQHNVALAETSENRALVETEGDVPCPTQQNDALSKATSCCYAKQHNVAHSVSTLVQEVGSEGGVGETEPASSPTARTDDEDQIDIEDAIRDANERLADAAEPAQPAKKKSTTSRKTGFPPKEYWSDEDRAYGVKQGLTEDEVRREFRDFRDFHLSKGSKFVCWRSAWQLWCRRAVDYRAKSKKPGTYKSSGPATADDQLRAIRALTAGLDKP